jgi:hypothetical protein
MIPQWIHEEVKQERDEANQRCEWVAAELHGDPIFGAGAVDLLVIQVNALRTQRDKAKEDATRWEQAAYQLSEVLADVEVDGFYEFSADKWMVWAQKRVSILPILAKLLEDA